MKLRHKITGMLGELFTSGTNGEIMNIGVEFGNEHTCLYRSISELNSEWEDYEEPKVGYMIDHMEEDCISADDSGYTGSDVERAKELGIWFETEEEAERAVEKLKAYKRLKDKGFRFVDFDWKNGIIRFEESPIKAGEESDKFYEDLDLLFGEEEE